MDATSKYPSFSVVVNNYNYEKFLAAALDSALHQLSDDDEMVVVDDGSTDGSLEILARYESNPQVAVIRQKNAGQMNAVRTGLLAAKGDVLLLLDSDDEYIEGYLDRLRGIYQSNPEVECVLSAPQIKGPNEALNKSNRKNIEQMAFPMGSIGSTRWATQMFYEFVGVPTSGLSLKKDMAQIICELPTEVDARTSISPTVIKLLGISSTEASKSGYSADGVIVRVSSLLNGVKYYDVRAGFIYQIHGGNKYAAMPKVAQFWLRRILKRNFIKLSAEYLGLAKRPSAVEIKEEILQRSFAVSLRRRAQIRTLYALVALRSKGSVAQRIDACVTALFKSGG